MSDPQRDTAQDPADDDVAQDNQFVTFSLAGEMFAVSMAPVQEIIRVPEVARLPLAPSTLDGLANLRGRVLPIINLRRLFGCEPRALDDATRAVVINLGQPLGFVVDHVASVLSVEASRIEAASSIRSIVASDFITGVIRHEDEQQQTQLLLVLDFARLIEQEFAQVRLDAESRRIEQADEIEALADTPEVEAEAEEQRLVSFAVAGQEYAIDIAHVQEIVQLPERITALPNRAAHVLGVISLRQRLLPLVSLRSLFHLPTVEAGEQHRIVVIALPDGAQVGLVTDAVKEVLSVPHGLAEPMPALLARDGSLSEFSAICRLEEGRRLVSIIDTRHLLGVREIREAVQAAHDKDHTLAEDPMAHRMNHDRVEADQAERDDDDTQVVIFRLGAEEFGVPIMSVQEIVRVPESLTRVPRTPRFVEGVINLRGTVLPVIDQRTRLGMEAIGRNDRQRIMVYLLAGVRTGFIVDSVAEVLRIPRQRIEAAPELSAEQGRLISHVAKLDGDRRLVMLIEPAHLLATGEVDAMTSWADPAEPAREPAAPVTRHEATHEARLRQAA
jgi:purine-binding chemotaxis protein CheW